MRIVHFSFQSARTCKYATSTRYLNFHLLSHGLIEPNSTLKIQLELCPEVGSGMHVSALHKYVGLFREKWFMDCSCIVRQYTSFVPLQCK